MDHLNVLRITTPNTNIPKRDDETSKESDTLKSTSLKFTLLSRAHGEANLAHPGGLTFTVGVVGD